MEQVDHKHYSRQGPTRFTYEGGLKNLFAACHDPMPSKMERLLRSLESLEDNDRYLHGSGQFSPSAHRFGLQS